MNKLSLVVFGLMVASPARASTYSIDLDGQVNGSKPIKGSVVVNEGETGEISFKAGAQSALGCLAALAEF